MRLVCNKTDVGVRQPHFREQQSTGEGLKSPHLQNTLL